MYISLHVNYQLFLSDFNEIRIFSIDFQKKSKISNLTKIHPVGAKLFHEDRQAGRQAGRHGQANTSFSQFCESA